MHKLCKKFCFISFSFFFNKIFLTLRVKIFIICTRNLCKNKGKCRYRVRGKRVCMHV